MTEAEFLNCALILAKRATEWAQENASLIASDQARVTRQVRPEIIARFRAQVTDILNLYSTFPVVPGYVPPPMPDELTAPIHCQADRDGDCLHPGCPQLRDGEPKKSGRHCPLDDNSDTYE